MIDIAMIVSGLILLLLGGEGLIKGAVSLAGSFGLSKLLVSAVIVGFGTSMPEMTVSMGAAMKGASDIALGNVVGSNIANILLIVGVVALIAPIKLSAQAVRSDTLVMLFATLVLCGLTFVGVINFITGSLMFMALLCYISWSYIQDKKKASDVVAHIEEDIEGKKQLGPIMAAAFSVGGLALLIAGAYLLVEGAVALARDFGISEAIIGLTVVAIGTSLPELATGIVAGLRRHTDIVIGNVLGSNIFNIFAILALTALVLPIPVTGQIAQKDVWIMLAVAIFISIYLLRGKTIGRMSGGAMVAVYIGYTAWLYMQS